MASWSPFRFNFALNALVVCVALSRATLAGPVLQGTTEPAAFNIPYAANFMNGFSFVPSTNGTITELGIWDSASDGLSRSFDVGLWDTTSFSLLASATIDNADPLDNSLVVEGGSWRYETLGSPVALTGGTSYTIGWQTGASQLSASEGLFLAHSSLLTDPNISVASSNNDRFFNSGGTLSFPFLSQTQSVVRGMANARFTAVPEPSCFLPIALAFLALSTRRGRERNAERRTTPRP